MRILYSNQWDLYSLTESQEDASYPVENTQDIRLVKTWRTTTASAATVIITSGSAAKAIFQATTNLLEDTDDLTQWTTVGSIVTSSGLFYDSSEFWKVKNSGAAAGYILQYITATATTFTPSGNVVCRKGSSAGNTAKILVFNSTSAVTICDLPIDFDNYPSSPGTATIGNLRWYKWIDAETIELHYTCSALSFLTDDMQVFLYGSLNATADEYTYWMKPQLEDLSYDTPYVDGSRSAANPSYAFEMPEKFVFKVKIRSWFAYNTTIDHTLFVWYIDAGSRFMLFYAPELDTFRVIWEDNGTARALTTEQFDDGSSYDDINSEIIFFGAIDLSTQTGNNVFFAIVDGSKQAEDNAWSGALDARTSTFDSFRIGHYNSSNHADSLIEYVKFWAWDGVSLGTLGNEADIDAAMAGKPTIFEQIYLPKIKANCAAILNHNLSADATIGIQGNDYDSWNGLTVETMTWRADTIVTFITEASYPFWRFTITDPNVEDDYFEVGRFFLGTYVQISPSSLVEFPVKHVRNDRTMWSRSNQLYADQGVGWKELHYKFPRSTNSMKSSVETMWGSCGKFKPILVMNYDTTFTIIDPLYCVVVENIVFTHLKHDFWSYDLHLREAH